MNLEDAIILATEQHRGQVDKQGHPYILHPLRVMVAMPLGNEHLQMAAVLHDVIEDTLLTIDDLLGKGVPTDVVDMLRVLTHVRNEPYMDYVRRCCKDYRTLVIKRADVQDNLSRLSLVTDRETRLRLTGKYAAAWAYLCKEGTKLAGESLDPPQPAPSDYVWEDAKC